jgi:purine-binding chemotaxis protein CheW
MIDWAKARDRLRKSQEALGRELNGGREFNGHEPSNDPQHVQAVFRERAARLARRQTPVAAGSAAIPLLVFRLRGESYGIALEDLAEVIPCPKCAPIPGSSPELAGVINVRGEIRPVWDPTRLLNLGAKEADQPGCVLLVRRKGRELGLWADQAERVRFLQPQEWTQPEECSPYVKGVTVDAVMILNTEALFNEARTTQ